MPTEYANCTTLVWNEPFTTRAATMRAVDNALTAGYRDIGWFELDCYNTEVRLVVRNSQADKVRTVLTKAGLL